MTTLFFQLKSIIFRLFSRFQLLPFPLFPFKTQFNPWKIIPNEWYLSLESKCKNYLFGSVLEVVLEVVLNMKKFRIQSEGKQLISNNDNCLLF